MPSTAAPFRLIADETPAAPPNIDAVTPATEEGSPLAVASVPMPEQEILYSNDEDDAPTAAPITAEIKESAATGDVVVGAEKHDTDYPDGCPVANLRDNFQRSDEKAEDEGNAVDNTSVASRAVAAEQAPCGLDPNPAALAGDAAPPATEASATVDEPRSAVEDNGTSVGEEEDAPQELTPAAVVVEEPPAAEEPVAEVAAPAAAEGEDSAGEEGGVEDMANILGSTIANAFATAAEDKSVVPADEEKTTVTAAVEEGQPVPVTEGLVASIEESGAQEEEATEGEVIVSVKEPIVEEPALVVAAPEDSCTDNVVSTPLVPLADDAELASVKGLLASPAESSPSAADDAAEVEQPAAVDRAPEVVDESEAVSLEATEENEASAVPTAEDEGDGETTAVVEDGTVDDPAVDSAGEGEEPVSTVNSLAAAVANAFATAVEQLVTDSDEEKSVASSGKSEVAADGEEGWEPVGEVPLPVAEAGTDGSTVDASGVEGTTEEVCADNTAAGEAVDNPDSQGDGTSTRGIEEHILPTAEVQSAAAAAEDAEVEKAVAVDPVVESADDEKSDSTVGGPAVLVEKETAKDEGVGASLKRLFFGSPKKKPTPAASVVDEEPVLVDVNEQAAGPGPDKGDAGKEAQVSAAEGEVEQAAAAVTVPVEELSAGATTDVSAEEAVLVDPVEAPAAAIGEGVLEPVVGDEQGELLRRCLSS